MKKLTLLVLFLVAAGACFAPLLDKPQSSSFHGELSESEMARLQGSGTSAGPVNEVQGTEESNQPRAVNANESSDAKKSLKASSANSAGASAASLSLTKSNSDLKPNESHGPNIFVGLLFVIIGVGVFFGVRTYLDKAVADPFDKPSRSKSKF